MVDKDTSAFYCTLSTQYRIVFGYKKYLGVYQTCSETYCESSVVENLVHSATEKVRHASILERVVDPAWNISPVVERQRILGIDAVATTVPVVHPA